MTLKEKKALHRRFFAKIGSNAETFKQVLDAAPQLCLCIKDTQGRIMALNRHNCEVCNIRDEWDAIGLRSDEVFPARYADAYMALDEEVLKSGKPVLGRITEYPTDRSTNFMVSDVHPLRDGRNRIIGIVRAYRIIASRKDDTFDRYGQMRQVSKYIAEHFAANITLKDLVAQAGMSLSRFERIFAETFSTTPLRYLALMRVNAARTLLENSDKLLSEIAAETGFFDQSHFTRVFKRERGLTPGEYRRQHLRR